MEMHGSGRRYSGYDEYEGIFGPLGGSTSNKGGSRSLSSKYGRSSSSGAAAIGFGSRGFPATRWPRTPVLSTNGYERRQRYLTERVGKRRMAAIGAGDAGDDDDDKHDADVPRRSDKQIWLPTKNFTFRQRAGKLDTRTIARLDLEKIVATTDVEAIQRHLENVAFSDVTLEDVQQYSDAYFLKLFQIAQLTLEYLLNVQDSLASHCENLETQCEGLANECQSLEVENHKVESEIVAMKKEIRQKQSTLATFEMMLLNATAAKRANQGLRVISQQQRDEENDPAVLNILGGPVAKASDGQEEICAVPLVSSCVLCGKKFISPEYLLRHQHKKHRDYAAEKDARKQSRTKAKKHSDSSSESDARSSDSGSSGKKTKKRREPKTAPLPAEVIQALNERNELSKQLMELQFQLRSEKERRVEEGKAMEQQQAQLTTQLASYMAKLQDTLVEMERKQEQSKHEMMRYTQETIERVKNEQAERVRDAKKSHAGRLQSDGESDGDERRGRKPKAGAQAPDAASEVERRILDSLLRAQAETQQKNSELEQANRRLQNRLKRRARQLQAEPPATALMSMAALDAQRFGIDVGAALDEEKPVVRPKAVVVEDKPVQTDEEKQPLSKKIAATTSQVVQTEMPIEPAPVAKPEPKEVKSEPPKPLLKSTESKIPKPKLEAKAAPPPPQPKREEKSRPEEDAKPQLSADTKEPDAVKPPPVEAKPESKLQHAAHLVGKVALGFLTRSVLKDPSNWLLTLPASSLLGALSESELLHLTHGQSSGTVQDITVEIEDDMTANDLRVAFAEALSGMDNGRNANDDEDDVLVIDYHRVLLHHRLTGQEITGDQFIYHLRNQLEVEIIPRFDAAETHVDDVLSFHQDATSQLRDIRRASLDLTPEEVGYHTPERRAHKAATRIQSIARRFLAFRLVEMMKIDRLVEARLLFMRASSPSSSPRPARSKSARRLTRSASVVVTRVETTDETVVSEKAQEIHGRLADLVKAKTGVDTRTKSAKWSRGRLSTEDYERHVEEIQRKRTELPVAVQTRIQQIAERVEKLVEDSYDPEAAEQEEDQYFAASKIQLSIQVGIARKKLKQLLGLKHAQEAKSESESTIEKEKVSASTRRSESEAKEEDERDEDKEEEKPEPRAQEEEVKEEEDASLDVEELDDSEIKRLADAYEEPAEAKKPAPEPALETQPPPLEEKAPAVDIFAPVTRARAPKPDVVPRPGTPPPTQEDLVGRSPRPHGDAHVISPFSKTPLLSRRAPPSRRGSGYDNAR